MASQSAKEQSDSPIVIYPKRVPPIGDLVRAKVEKLDKQNRDDSFFVIDLGEISKKLEQWRRLMPRVRPFYAMKCNSDSEVCRFLADAGTGFDCASEREIQQILDLGVHPSRIVYANPCKPKTHLRYAQSQRVSLMTFDDYHELVKIKDSFPEARLLLRIQSSKEHKAKHDFNKKFGCDPDFAPELLEQAKMMGLNVVGVSFHVGSLPEEVSCFATTIRSASEVFTCGEKMGFDMKILDIGGGFPGVDEENMNFGIVATAVNAALKTYFPVSRGTDIIAEPGRYLVTSAFTVAVNVIAKRVVQIPRKSPKLKRASDSCASLVSRDSDYAGEESDDCLDLDSSADDIDDNGNESVNMYFVNDGVYGAFNNVFTDHAVIYPKTVKPPVTSETHLSMVWGPTCDGLDLILHECQMPPLDAGDWLYFHNMGAYTVSLSCGFNGIPRPLQFYVCADTYWNQVYPIQADPAVTTISPETPGLSLKDLSVTVEAQKKPLAARKSCGVEAEDFDIQRKKSYRLVVGKGQ